MPLHWLVILVVGGIAGTAVATWAMGWSRRFQITGDVTARAEWARHWPDLAALRILIAPGGDAALVQTPGGWGLLRSFGADTVAHLIRSHDATDRILTLDFGDFGSPPVRLRLDDETLALWTRALKDDP